MQVSDGFFSEHFRLLRSETKRCFPPTRCRALQGARSSTPEPGRRSPRRERRESSVRRPCSVAAARRCVRADSPTRAHPPRSRRDENPPFLFKSQRSRSDLALPPSRPRPGRRVPSLRRPSHRQPFGGAGSAPAFGAGSAPAFGAAPAAGAASVRALFFHLGIRRASLRAVKNIL